MPLFFLTLVFFAGCKGFGLGGAVEEFSFVLTGIASIRALLERLTRHECTFSIGLFMNALTKF